MFFNVREDATFVEAPYLEQGERCIAWIESAMREPLLILEIGAGFKTPGVVRYPLERLAAQHALDVVGNDVPTDWIGRRIWCYGATTSRSQAVHRSVPVNHGGDRSFRGHLTQF